MSVADVPQLNGSVFQLAAMIAERKITKRDNSTEKKRKEEETREDRRRRIQE
jgi:hypothetical protein